MKFKNEGDPYNFDEDVLRGGKHSRLEAKAIELDNKEIRVNENPEKVDSEIQGWTTNRPLLPRRLWVYGREMIVRR